MINIGVNHLGNCPRCGYAITSIERDPLIARCVTGHTLVGPLIVSTWDAATPVYPVGVIRSAVRACEILSSPGGFLVLDADDRAWCQSCEQHVAVSRGSEPFSVSCPAAPA